MYFENEKCEENKESERGRLTYREAKRGLREERNLQNYKSKVKN